MPLNARDAVMSMNTKDFINSLQINLENFSFSPQATQCILNKEKDNGD